MYVGYGDEKTGAIGMVDAATNKRLDDEFKLGAHPESCQLAASDPNIYVNLPDLKQIAVVNRGTHSIVRWPLTFESNFPMALDEADHRLPAREIAEVIGRRLNVPVVSKTREVATEHFGWIGQFFAMDGPASSAPTRAWLGWRPTRPGLLADLEANYFEQTELAAD